MLRSLIVLTIDFDPCHYLYFYMPNEGARNLAGRVPWGVRSA